MVTLTEHAMNELLLKAFAPDLTVRIAADGRITSMRHHTDLGRQEKLALLGTEFRKTWHVSEFDANQPSCCVEYVGPYFNA